MNRNEVATATTSDLVKFYNSKQDAAGQIKKFTNRETAIRRVLDLIDSLAVEDDAADAELVQIQAPEVVEEFTIPAQEEGAPVRDFSPATASFGMTIIAKHVPGLATQEQAPAEAPKKAGKTRLAEQGGSTPKPAVARRSNATGIALSWLDKDVYAARVTRNGVLVSVNGAPAQEFTSTKAAFEALDLPIVKHIRFRMKLKAEGHQAIEHGGNVYKFAII
ncbi:hypothetical protein XccvBFoX7_gp98c [Xanthomonas phage FoX7]|uniref:Uncharacterized protein n=2 Tax=Carpasinavirus XcP1 TaxID=2182344 RepID=A0A858NR44_9CAUD|nr:hypothetical protein XccvBFoX6_gp98c [Xanthomonas phage FoX6]QJB22255.1 hypothetical protein XccvBFoX7_gp98c [Xanthomonas phage FoX7]